MVLYVFLFSKFSVIPDWEILLQYLPEYGLLHPLDWGWVSFVEEGFLCDIKKVSFSKLLVALDLPSFSQYLEIISLKLELALLYVVINISGVSTLVARFLGAHSCFWLLYLIVPMPVRFHCGDSFSRENKRCVF